ncbi:MAG: AMP-binding protein, partial [Anaerolineae bacterium]
MKDWLAAVPSDFTYFLRSQDDIRAPYTHVNTKRFSDWIVAKRAAQFARAGIRRGDRVALYCGDDRATIEVVWALIRLGAIAVPLNLRLTPEEHDYQLQHVGCRTLITLYPDEA